MRVLDEVAPVARPPAAGAMRLFDGHPAKGAASPICADRETLSSAVRQVWRACLPAIAFDPEQTWSETGIDSLKAMEFVLRLEKALGRPVGFDGLSQDATANDLINQLIARPTAGADDDDGLPRIFLIPGVFGDDPGLAEVRRDLRYDARFEVLALPDLESSSRVIGDLGASADALMRILLARQPDGPVRLVGYSYGGLVAQEIAARLETRGRVVTHLALLDGFLRPEGLPDPRRKPGPPTNPLRTRSVWGWAMFLLWLTGPILRAINAVGMARSGLNLASPILDAGWRDKQRRYLLLSLRGVAISNWKPTPCHAPTLLVASDEFDRFGDLDGWRAICPRLTIVHAPGDHRDVLRGEGQGIIVEALRGSLAVGPTEAAA